MHHTVAAALEEPHLEMYVTTREPSAHGQTPAGVAIMRGGTNGSHLFLCTAKTTGGQDVIDAIEQVSSQAVQASKEVVGRRSRSSSPSLANGAECRREQHARLSWAWGQGGSHAS
jgi:hypothetical protein